MDFADMVKQDLLELKKLGIKVPSRAFEMVEDKEEMKEYDNMKVSECADLIISLSQIS